MSEADQIEGDINRNVSKENTDSGSDHQEAQSAASNENSIEIVDNPESLTNGGWSIPPEFEVQQAEEEMSERPAAGEDPPEASETSVLLEVPTESTEIAAGGGGKESISRRRKFSAPHLARSDEDLQSLRAQYDQGRKTSMPTAANRPELRRLTEGEQRRIRQRSRTYGPGDGDLAPLPGGDREGQMNEARVAQEAEEIVHSFMVSSYQRDLRHEYGEPEGTMNEAAASPGFVDDTPNIPELTHFPGNPLSPATLVGRRLAVMGDEFQDRYEGELDDMVNMLLPHIISSSIGSRIQEAYDSFRTVAMRIFAQGSITWGRIIALFCFGYRMAVALFRHGIRDFVGTVIKLILKFLVGEIITASASSIVRWVAQRGGWNGALEYRLDTEVLSGALSFVANNWFRTVTAAVVVLWVWGALRGSSG